MVLLSTLGSCLGSAMHRMSCLWARPLILVFCGLPFILCLVYLDSRFFRCDNPSQCVHIVSFRVQISILASRCYRSMNDNSSCCVKLIFFVGGGGFFVVVLLCFFLPPMYFLCREQIDFLLIFDPFYDKTKAF